MLCEVNHCLNEGTQTHHMAYRSLNRLVERVVRLCEQHHKEITDAHSRMSETVVRIGNRIHKSHRKLTDDERIAFDQKFLKGEYMPKDHKVKDWW